MGRWDHKELVLGLRTSRTMRVDGYCSKCGEDRMDSVWLGEPSRERARMCMVLKSQSWLGSRNAEQTHAVERTSLKGRYSKIWSMISEGNCVSIGQCARLWCGSRLDSLCSYGYQGELNQNIIDSQKQIKLCHKGRITSFGSRCWTWEKSLQVTLQTITRMSRNWLTGLGSNKCRTEGPNVRVWLVISWYVTYSQVRVSLAP